MNIGTAVESLDISPQFLAYTKVRIYVGVDDDGADVVYEAGSETGRTLELKNPFGTQEMANNILSSLGTWQYQPYTAKGAVANPALELGDPVTINGVDSAIYIRATHFGALHVIDISAPYDEEVDHEYQFESSEHREYKRQYSETKASLKITATQIAAEVARASAAEGSLASSITQTATEIRATVAAETNRATAAELGLSRDIADETERASAAEVSLSSEITQTAAQISASVTEVSENLSDEVERATNAESGKLDHTHSSSTFGWELNATSFLLKSNNSTVFKCNKDGVEITGKITATSGYIGSESSGFEITASAIKNGMTSFSDTAHNGIYIGTDGISLGGGKFKVDSQGNMTASSGTFSGSVHASAIISDGDSDRMPGSYISAGSIGIGSGSALSSGAINGISLGNFFGDAITSGTSSYPDYFRVGNVTANSGGFLNSLAINQLGIGDDYKRAGWSYFNAGTDADAWITSAGGDVYGDVLWWDSSKGTYLVTTINGLYIGVDVDCAGSITLSQFGPYVKGF